MTDTTLDVSVVVVTHNRPALLTVLIEAELAQTVQPREIIVVDNGTDDDTPQLLARYAGRVASKRVTGLSRDRSRNLGIESASGAWISLIDDDDYHCPDFLERAAEVIADGRANLIGTDYQPFDAASNMDRTRFSSMPDGYWHGIKDPSDSAPWTFVGKFPLERLLVRNLLEPGQMLVERSLLYQCGQFNVDFPYRIGEMFELNARLLERSALALIWQPLLMYRRHPGNLTQGGFDNRYFKLRTIEYLRDHPSGRSLGFLEAIERDISVRRGAVFAQAFAFGEAERVAELYDEFTPSERSWGRKLMLRLSTLPAPAARFSSWFLPRALRRLGRGQELDLI